MLCVCTASLAAPFTPAADSEVVERLPLASDPAARRVESLRRQLTAQPDNAALRVEIARRYFDLAMAQGDPRLVGYASAAIAPLESKAPADAGYWLVRGLIAQYSHDFDAALASLGKASQLDARAAEPLSWQAAVFMVQARYADARKACEQLTPLADPLLGAGCGSYVQATTGALQPAFDTLAALLKAAPQTPAPLQLWLDTRLGEMAWRLQRFDLAEGYFKHALSLGITDQFLLGAYADFLLDRNRAAEAITLLQSWERSDILLLRLALAGRVVNDKRAADWAAQLRDRFQAAGQRGDRLHEQEAARFEMDIERNGARALELAARNYEVQKEPRDAQVLMRAALAAGQPRAAQPALDWLRTSGYQDPGMATLAGQLAAAGAAR